jgi:hypothetical protein
MVFEILEIWNRDTTKQQSVAPQVTGEPQQPPIQSPVSNQRGFVPLIIGFAILLVVVGIGAYYLGTQKNNQVITNNNQAIPSPTTSDIIRNTSPTSNPVSIATLPEGWLYKGNNECDVKFPIPPKKEPYYSTPDSNRPPSVTGDEGSGRFWDFPRGGVYPNILSKLISNNQEYKQATTMYATVDEASGYVSSAVVVSCIRNTGNLNNLSMLNSLKSKLQEYNNDKSEKGMQASTYTIKSSNEVSRWNSKVYDLTMAEYYSNPGGQPITNSIEYTMFTTPKYIYEVRVMGATDNSFVKETARKIFDNLQFTSN